MISRKGNVISDGLIIMVSLFVLGTIWFYSYSAFDDIKPTLDSEGFSNDTTEVYTSLHTDMNVTLDSAFMLCLVFLWAGAIILSFFVDTHPVFFILSIILLLALIFIGMILANNFVETLTEEGLLSQFPMMYFVFNHLVGFILAIASSIAISLYAKTKL